MVRNRCCISVQFDEVDDDDGDGDDNDDEVAVFWVMLVRTIWAALALANNDLLGTHPVQVQSPPKAWPSINKQVFFNVRVANLAAVSPALPPPITIKS